jgi:tetratricopeptide (TPR) repeat protein
VKDSTAVPQKQTGPEGWSLAAVGAWIAGLVLVCYWPALRGGMLWDDAAHVTAPELRSWAGLGRIWTEIRATQQFYPVLHSTFWIEHRLWGDAVLGYHLANVAQHALAALLLVGLLRRWEVPGATWAGLIFAVHPVAVESVAWISEQKNTLSLVFYLAAALAYRRFDERRGQAGSGWRYAGATVLFGLALLTKTVTASLPAALLVVAWWRRGTLTWRRDVGPLVPWFVAGLAAGVLTAWVERKLIGAEGAPFELTFIQRGLLAGRVIWFYAGKLVWPTELMFIYPRWNVAGATWLWSGWLVAVVAVTAGAWWWRGKSRGPLAAWLLFVGSLFPVLGFFNVFPFLYSYVADHFQYLASIGLIAGATAGVVIWGGGSRWWQGAGAAVIAVLVGLSHAQSRMYADVRTLYRTTIAKNPACWMAHNNLGAELLDLNSPAAVAEAAGHFEAALRIKPDHATAHYNLGNALAAMPGRLNDAITHYEEALRLKPNNAEQHNNLGNALVRVPGRINEAIAHYETALRLKPDAPETHNNLGNTWLKIGGHEREAAAHYEAVLRLRPDHAVAHNNLGSALENLPGRLDEAIEHYRAAGRAKPDYAEAFYNLGNALMKREGRAAEAVAAYQEAVRLRPDYAEAHNNLGGAWSNIAGRLGDAIAEHETALRLKPDYAEAHYNLAVALLRTPGRGREAKAHLDAFYRLWPDKAQAREIIGALPEVR